MSSEQNKREKNKIAVREHRDRKRLEDKERREDIQKLREENMRLESSIQALRAQEELFRNIIEAHVQATGGQFSSTPEGSQIIENLFLTGQPGVREQERREEGR